MASPKNFKSISIFDFGVKFGVKLPFRSKVKAISDAQIKAAQSSSNDLRDAVIQDRVLHSQFGKQNYRGHGFKVQKGSRFKVQKGSRFKVQKWFLYKVHWSEISRFFSKRVPL